MKTVRARAAGARRRLAARVHRVIQTRQVTGAKPGRAYKSPKESREAFSRWSGCLVDLTVDRLRRELARPPRAEHLADGFHVRLDVGERLDAPKRHLRLERELAVAVPEEGEETKQVEQRGSAARSEERRVGKECRSRWSAYH